MPKARKRGNSRSLASPTFGPSHPFFLIISSKYWPQHARSASPLHHKRREVHKELIAVDWMLGQYRNLLPLTRRIPNSAQKKEKKEMPSLWDSRAAAVVWRQIPAENKNEVIRDLCPPDNAFLFLHFLSSRQLLKISVIRDVQKIRREKKRELGAERSSGTSCTPNSLAQERKSTMRPFSESQSLSLSLASTWVTTNRSWAPLQRDDLRGVSSLFSHLIWALVRKLAERSGGSSLWAPK